MDYDLPYKEEAVDHIQFLPNHYSLFTLANHMHYQNVIFICVKIS